MAIAGGIVGLAILSVSEPCYADAFMTLTGWGIDTASNTGTGLMAAIKEAWDCVDSRGSAEIATYTIVGASIACVGYIVLALICHFCTLCTCCKRQKTFRV